MLSQNLRCLHDALAKYDGDGVVFEDAAVCGIVSILKAAIEDAEALEARPIPTIDRMPGALPENVIRIASLLNRRDQQSMRAGPKRGEGS